MRPAARRVCLLAALSVGGWAAAQGRDTVYKIVGPDGKVTYSQEPAPGGAAAKKMEFEHLPASPLPAYVLKFRQEMERGMASRQAAPPPAGVQLFSAKWCGYCKLAKAWLGRNGTAYQELDIDTPDGMAAFVRAGAKGSVPLLVGPNNLRVQGFSEAAYASALGVRKP